MSIILPVSLSDLLPARTLPTLMKEFEGRLPHPLPDNSRLEPLWCFKYTVLIRDRGVLADKGWVIPLWLFEHSCH